MKFRLNIDRDKEEEIVATVHERSVLTDKIETLVMQYTGADKITAYTEDDTVLLPFARIECIVTIDGKTCAIDTTGARLRLKQRLYEVEEMVPSYFIRINKSALANERRIERFAATYSGGVNAVFRCGYTEYVSRRCFAEIKRRFNAK